MQLIIEIGFDKITGSSNRQESIVVQRNNPSRKKQFVTIEKFQDGLVELMGRIYKDKLKLVAFQQ